MHLKRLVQLFGLRVRTLLRSWFIDLFNDCKAELWLLLVELNGEPVRDSRQAQKTDEEHSCRFQHLNRWQSLARH